MSTPRDPVAAVCKSLQQARSVMSDLEDSGFDTKQVSIVGNGYASGPFPQVNVPPLGAGRTVGRLTGLQASFMCLGVSKFHGMRHEMAITKGNYLVIVHGDAQDVALARLVIAACSPSPRDRAATDCYMI